MSSNISNEIGMNRIGHKGFKLRILGKLVLISTRSSKIQNGPDSCKTQLEKSGGKKTRKRPFFKS